MTIIRYHINAHIANDALNNLFDTAWQNHQYRNFQAILAHSLVYVCAYHQQLLVGFVNLAWDGGIHAFLLDTTVHVNYQHQGIGRELVHHATEAAKARGIVWLHVDFEPHLREFYAQCGFKLTEAGLMHLRE